MEQLPPGWTWSNLGSVLREPLRNGHSAKRAADGIGVRTLTLTAVTKGDFSEANTKVSVADPAKVEALWLEPGDILVERSNTPDLVGTTRMYDGPPRFAIFPDLVIRARIAEHHNPAYVAYYMQTPGVRQYFKQAAQGIAGSMPKIDQTTVARLRLPLAPVDEQDRIVAAIEEHFSRLDSGSAALSASRRRVRSLKKAVLAAVFGDDRNESKDGPSQAGERLRGAQLFSFVTSGSRGWAKYYADHGPMFLRMGNLDHDTISLDIGSIQHVQPPIGAEGTRTRVHPGDVLISITADVGMVGLVPDNLGEAYINQHIALARPIPLVNPKYLAWFLASPSGQKQLHAFQRGATKIGLGLDDIRAVEMSLPSRETQDAEVERVERLISVAMNVEQMLIACDRQADVLRGRVLSHAFRGRLTHPARLAREYDAPPPSTRLPDHVLEVPGAAT